MTKSIPASISQFLRLLADRSALVSAQAARKVWQQFGIEDRMGYSILGGHPHCMLDKFLLGKPTDTGNIQKAVF